jgi:hypothetical protein
MKCTFVKLVGAVYIIVASSAGYCDADPPDVLQSFRFIPARSTVHVTGGFAGLDWPLHVRGTFDFVTGFDQPSVLTLVPYAKFENVEGKLFNPLSTAPIDMPGWDLDDTLNLSGLAGRRQSTNQYFFKGLEGQGQPIELKVATRGRLMQITGASQPGCCDFFKYEVKALAVRGPYADFDLSGSIDTSDLNVLVANIGMRSGATFAQGDADADADIDGNDFLVWQRQVGAATSLAEFDGLGQ